MKSVGRVVWLLALVSLVGYALRTNIAIAQEYMAPERGLSMTQIGVISAWGFQLAYAVFRIPGGFLGDRYGSQVVMGFAVIGWSIASLASAMAGGGPGPQPADSKIGVQGTAPRRGGHRRGSARQRGRCPASSAARRTRSPRRRRRSSTRRRWPPVAVRTARQCQSAACPMISRAARSTAGSPRVGCRIRTPALVASHTTRQRASAWSSFSVGNMLR